MRENCTYGSMRGSRRKTAKSVLRVVEDRAGVPCGGVSLYSTPFELPDGSFTKADPRGGWQVWHGDNAPDNYWGDFYEGSAWDYSWNAWHDLPYLMDLMGGKEKFLERLSYAFDSNLIEYGNEPSFMTPFLFDFVGRCDLATKWARAFRAKYTDKGCPGDDDAGAMGSMYVFLTMGFNPIAGQDLYALHTPAVPEVRLALPASGKTLTLRVARGKDTIPA